MGAPVCNINPKSPPPSSRAPALPSIPPANDLPSLITAVNALRQWVIQYGNLVPPSINIPVPSLTDFVEDPAGRVTTETNIYDPNDPSNETYITVSQITGLTFVNGTGQTIVWNQNP